MRGLDEYNGLNSRTYHSVHNEVGEGRLIEEGGTEHHQRVEPTSSLVQTLSDEVSRETFLETLLHGQEENMR